MLASLLFSSVRRGDAPASVVVPIIDDSLRSYTEALRVEARDISFEDVRQGFDAAIALRWKLAVDVVASLERAKCRGGEAFPRRNPQRHWRN